MFGFSAHPIFRHGYRVSAGLSRRELLIGIGRAGGAAALYTALGAGPDASLAAYAGDREVRSGVDNDPVIYMVTNS